MKNGADPRVVASFDAIADLPDAWDHNRQYHRVLLAAVPPTSGLGLDIGCGTGEFTAALAGRCGSVLGIDLSPRMVEEADRRNSSESIRYKVAAAETVLGGHPGEFSAIVSIASLHHMDPGDIFPLARAALAPGGVFAVLDILEGATLVDHVYSAASSILDPLYRLAKNGTLATNREERLAWEEHSAFDRYATLADIRRHADGAFGEYSLRRLMFWRYLLVYRKPGFLVTV